MPIEIKVPAMGESISEATVGTILKPSGSFVKPDDEILELETDKVNQVLYAQGAGQITLTVKTGDHVTIGQVIGTIETAIKEEPKKEEVHEKPEPIQPQQIKREGTSARIGKEAFLEQLERPDSLQPQPVKKDSVSAGIGKEPFIQQSEKPAVKESEKSIQTGREERRPMPKIRQVIAKRLVEAQQNAAMLTTFNEVDMSQVLLLREKYKDLFQKQHGVKLGFMSFFVKACVAALQEFPDFNSYIDGNEIVRRNYFDIGIAVSAEKGLFVPVVRNCDQLSFAGIESAIETYAKKAREGTISLEDLQGGGFTITNGGVFGSLLSTPILNAPQPGILGMHKIEKRPVVVNDQIVIRPMMYLALSYDHRLVDGKEAVSFLVEIKNFLEDPARLVLEV